MGTSLGHSGDRENSEYFFLKTQNILTTIMSMRGIYHLLSDNLSRACDKKGEISNPSRTVNTPYATWSGGLGRRVDLVR